MIRFPFVLYEPRSGRVLRGKVEAEDLVRAVVLVNLIRDAVRKSQEN